jgi:hypothetical protein
MVKTEIPRFVRAGLILPWLQTMSPGGLSQMRLRVVQLLLLFGLLSGSAFCQPWDLLTFSKDPNGFPLNPVWRWQADYVNANPNWGATGAIATAFIAGQLWPKPLSSGPLTHNLMPYSSMEPSYDIYPHYTVKCNSYGAATDLIEQGHINFTEATFTGTLNSTPHHNPGDPSPYDDDVDNFYLDTLGSAVRGMAGPAGAVFVPGGPGYVAPYPGFLQLEFKYSETLGNFGGPTVLADSPYGPYWFSFANWLSFANVFSFAAGINLNPQKAQDMISGHEATVIALYGLDAVHPPPGPELHPVHALAIRENNIPGTPTEQDDYWAFFARISGSEGSCSSGFHTLNTSTIIIEIPPPYQYRDFATRYPLPGVVATVVNSSGFAVINQGANVEPTEFYSDQNGTFLTLHIPSTTTGSPIWTTGDYDPSAIYGEIHLHWSPPNEITTILPPPPHVKFPHPQINNHPSEAEETETKSWNMLSREQQEVAERVYKTLAPPNPPVRTMPVKVVVAKTPPSPPRVTPKVIDSPDKVDAKRTVAGFQALCIATHGDIPLFRGACTQFQPVTTLTPVGANGGPVSPQANGWYANPLFVLPKAISQSGFAIVETVLTLRPSGQKVTVSQGTSTPVQIPDGTTTVTYQSRDTLGNVEAPHRQTYRVGRGPRNTHEPAGRGKGGLAIR